ncbi:LrgB family protein [Pseudomaricurvus alcaniphilus]|uniref:LrgB family protein n=1 Tax=Pseudomaricurvus alcaniphilus TaxID=1166482 RepID=UPI00140D6F1C|nr:LrgB family protein [Pseudomaricurvus alcaniphilus]NHN38757.1 LrgB family protein [Pseudomaricurvus alcaniphilus]
MDAIRGLLPHNFLPDNFLQSNSLPSNPLLWLLLTLACYQAALWLYQRCGRRAIVHPIATSAPFIALLLWLSDIPYRDYVAANQLLYFLLGPTTVALAIPLYQEFHHIRKLALPVLLTVLLGSAVAALSAVGIAWLVGANRLVLLSLAPKSVTTPIAIGIAENIGALPTLTTGVVVFTGVIGTLLSPLVFYLLQLRDMRLQGVLLGLNAHGIGTARSFEIHPTAGAFATLSMGLTGIFSALTLPYAVRLF